MEGTFLGATAITSVMSTHLNQRLKWSIDHTLEAMLGEEVRVAAQSLAPPLPPNAPPLRWIPVQELYLPDNTQPGGLPVFFEGRLLEFERQIALVFVRLGAPSSAAFSAEGVVFFRGRAAVILHGPALVELAHPFQVERLPTNADNYWRDLHGPGAQFEFPLGHDGAAKRGS
jgi:hypothetical protein